MTERVNIQVRFNEVDPLGIVWHGHYMRYFEDGREAFGKKFGLTYNDVYSYGFVIPIVSIQCDYKRSPKYGDFLNIETTYLPCKAAKIKFSYQLYREGTRELVASGSSVQVFLDKSTMGLQLINPPFFEEWKKRHGQL